MIQWQEDQTTICEKISTTRRNFKVILKTVDDPVLLPIWLQHYLSFTDAGSIIIAYNMSTSPTVLDIYSRLPPDIAIFQYGDEPEHGFHNVIHDRKIYAGLYDALRLSCDHSIFVDTDELLFPIDLDLDRWNLKALRKH